MNKSAVYDLLPKRPKLFSELLADIVALCCYRVTEKLLIAGVVNCGAIESLRV